MNRRPIKATLLALGPSMKRWVALAGLAVVALPACSSDSDGFEPGAPLPTDAPTLPTTEANELSTSSSASTEPEGESTSSTTSIADSNPETTSTTEPTPPAETSTTIADELLTETPQAAGFDFPPAALRTDPASPNNNRVIEAEHEPIIAAYLDVFEADLAATSTWPLDPRASELLSAPITDRVLNGYVDGFAERTANNQVLDVSGGITSRPFVIEDDDGDPDRVIVWDCFIDATFWKDVDTGEQAPPDAYPNAGPPGVEFGWAAALVKVDGAWLVDEGGAEPRACD